MRGTDIIDGLLIGGADAKVLQRSLPPVYLLSTIYLRDQCANR